MPAILQMTKLRLHSVAFTQRCSLLEGAFHCCSFAVTHVGNSDDRRAPASPTHCQHPLSWEDPPGRCFCFSTARRMQPFIPWPVLFCQLTLSKPRHWSWSSCMTSHIWFVTSAGTVDAACLPSAVFLWACHHPDYRGGNFSWQVHSCRALAACHSTTNVWFHTRHTYCPWRCLHCLPYPGCLHSSCIPLPNASCSTTCSGSPLSQ